MRKRGAKNLEPDVALATRASKRLKEKKDRQSPVSVAAKAVARRTKCPPSLLKPSGLGRPRSKLATFCL